MFRRRRRPDRLWVPMGFPAVVLRRAIEDHVSALDLPGGARVLDFGCGAQPYRSIFRPDVEYIGADMPGNDKAEIEILDGAVSLPDGSIDLIVSTQVLEHVPDPHAYLSECRRLLRRPGGRLLLTTHGVMFYHPVPTDYWRWTTDGLARIVSASGLRPTSMTPLLGAVPVGLWLIMMNIQAKLPRGLRHLVVSLFNLAIRWSNRVEWSTYRADFVYVVLAQLAEQNMDVEQTETGSAGRTDGGRDE